MDIPEYYSAYLSTGNPGPLVPVVEHNREDIVSLAGILSALNLQLTSKDK
ncbi:MULTISPECIES: ribonuclease H-like domain-containing protein [Methanothermobacter]|uniref:Ribonuclease H-like domain-containing protein n=1 Tax=Methanothermobacter wolfeii TaxID=145261 RepID=A0A9E7UNS7_METWO|nr:ribonuclease H-like domain-containing protein [Methanothermobacter wolfeii]UXH32541.1 ribonuclease H-like domain-containing protein [Methanothermobacter wolfeii]